MNFEDIQIEYKCFEENVCIAHSYLGELVFLLNKFIYNYSKSVNCSIEFAEKLEEKLLYNNLKLIQNDNNCSDNYDN